MHAAMETPRRAFYEIHAVAVTLGAPSGEAGRRLVCAMFSGIMLLNDSPVTIINGVG